MLYASTKLMLKRNEQVKSMARIYSQATEVLVWLGEEDKYVDLAYDTLEELCWAIIVLAWKFCSVKLDIPLADVSNSALASLIDSELSDTVRRCTSPFWCLKNKGSTSEIFKALDLTSLDLERTAGLNELTTRTQIDFLC